MSNIDDIIKTLDATRYFSSVASLQKIIPQYSTALTAANAVKSLQPSTLIIDNVARSLHSEVSRINIAASHQKAESLFSQYFAKINQPLAFRDEITRMRTLHETISVPSSIAEMFSKQTKLLEHLNSSTTAINAAKLNLSQPSHSALASDIIASMSMVNKLAEVGIFAKRASLSEHFFEVPKTYSSFVQTTTEHLARNPSQEVATRLRCSLNLAEYQLLGITETFNTFVNMPDDDEELPKIKILSVPFIQQSEFLSVETIADEDDIQGLIKSSKTAQIVEVARDVLNLVVQCNEAAKTSQIGNDIFKPTTRLLEVYSNFPWLSANNKQELGNVVDCLYFIFYEGAGKDKLRFLNSYGGPLKEADCDLIWCIKHLRNKWSRHDPDHGKEQEIKKSWNELANKLNWLGLTTYPKSKYDFQTIHFKLLELAKEFLLLILENLTIKSQFAS